jgi:hypothetical protein
MAEIKLSIKDYKDIVISVTGLSETYGNKPREIDLIIKKSGSNHSFTYLLKIPNGQFGYDYEWKDYPFDYGVEYTLIAKLYYYTRTEENGGGSRLLAVESDTIIFDEGTVIPPNWTVFVQDYIRSDTDISLSCAQGGIYRFEICSSYKNKCQIRIRPTNTVETSTVETSWYLTTNEACDTSTGIPTNIYKSGSINMQSNKIHIISFDLTNDSYYFWIRASSIDEFIGQVAIEFDLPESELFYTLKTFPNYSYVSYSSPFNAEIELEDSFSAYYFLINFPTTETVEIYTEEASSVYICLTKENTNKFNTSTGKYDKTEFSVENSNGDVSGEYEILEEGRGIYTFLIRGEPRDANNPIKIYITTKGDTTRPANWVWSTTVSTALQNKGAVSTLTYTEWNNFVDKVQDFLTYKSKTNSITSAKMTSDNKVMTATKFNLVKDAIDSMSSTGISKQQPGNIVYGSYFITLADTLNSIE